MLEFELQHFLIIDEKQALATFLYIFYYFSKIHSNF